MGGRSWGKKKILFLKNLPSVVVVVGVNMGTRE